MIHLIYGNTRFDHVRAHGYRGSTGRTCDDNPSFCLWEITAQYQNRYDFRDTIGYVFRLFLYSLMTQALPDQLDLIGCNKEAIRTPGSIQPHGFMLTLSPALDVHQASANLASLTGVDVQHAIGKPLADVIGPDASARVALELGSDTLGQRPTYLGTVTLPNGNHFDVLGHLWDGVVIAEFEAVERAHPADFRHLYPLISDFLAKVNDHASIPALSDLAARHVRLMTGYGRVMVYQFDASGHGRVVAESKAADYDSYMNQSFPARRASCMPCRRSA